MSLFSMCLSAYQGYKNVQVCWSESVSVSLCVAVFYMYVFFVCCCVCMCACKYLCSCVGVGVGVCAREIFFLMYVCISCLPKNAGQHLLSNNNTMYLQFVCALRYSGNVYAEKHSSFVC
jgi:hypothetical protein